MEHNTDSYDNDPRRQRNEKMAAASFFFLLGGIIAIPVFIAVQKVLAWLGW